MHAFPRAVLATSQQPCCIAADASLLAVTHSCANPHACMLLDGCMLPLHSTPCGHSGRCIIAWLIYKSSIRSIDQIVIVPSCMHGRMHLLCSCPAACEGWAFENLRRWPHLIVYLSASRGRFRQSYASLISLNFSASPPGRTSRDLCRQPRGTAGVHAAPLSSGFRHSMEHGGAARCPPVWL